MQRGLLIPAATWTATRAVIATLAFVAVPLTFVSASPAAWNPPQGIASTNTGQYSRPQVARNAAGDTVATWYRLGPSGEDESGVLEAATRRANGPWSVPVRLASGHLGATAPTVVIDPRGEATVVWELSTTLAEKGKKRAGGQRVAVEVRSDRAGASGWGRTITLASTREPSTGGGEPDPQIAIDGRSDVSVAFQLREHHTTLVNGREDVLLFTRHGGHWHGAKVVGHTINSSETQLALNGRGETILAWNHGGPPGSREQWVQALVLSRHGKAEGRAQVLSSKGGTAYALDLAANGSGAAVLAWSQELSEGQGLGPAQAVTRPAGGRFSHKPVTLLQKSSPPVVTIDRQGTASALFERALTRGRNEADARGALEAATHPVNGGWSKPQPIAAEGDPEALASGPHEELLALWEVRFQPAGQPPQARPVIDSSIRPVGGPWQPPATISPERISEGSADLALDAEGQGTAIWVREPAYATYLIETADYQP
jgi:hypothetical protein